MTDDRSQSSLEVLKGARELLSDPSRWTQGSFARNASYEPVCIVSDEAVRFCSIGAIERVATYDRYLVNNCCDRLRAVIPGRRITEFNDSRNHEDVLTAFDKAIELAAQSQGSAAAGPSSSSPSGL